MNIEKFYRGAKYSPVVIGLSAASTWTWAPALILSSDIASNKGVLGVISFIIPNILALWLFSFIGLRISPFDLFKNKYIKFCYHIGFGAVELFCTIMQVTAGANVFKLVFGFNYWASIFCFVSVCLVISWFSGLHGSIISNIYQQLLLIVSTISLLFFVDFGNFKYGIINYYDLLIYTAILFSGPIMTNQHWQRHDKTGYILAGGLFAIPLFCLSSVGLFSGIDGNYISIRLFSGNAIALYLLSFSIILGLSSTLQSSMTSIISILGMQKNLKNARIKMVALSTAALFFIAMNIDIITIWKTMGSFRVIMAIGVVYAVCSRRYKI